MAGTQAYILVPYECVIYIQTERIVVQTVEGSVSIDAYSNRTWTLGRIAFVDVWKQAEQTDQTFTMVTLTNVK